MHGQAVRDGQVEAELISEYSALVPGQPHRLGLRLQMDQGWHTYWQNPGDSGIATNIRWDLPGGFVACEIDWPAPDYFELSGLASYGYEGEIVLPIFVEVPETVDAAEVTWRATVDWLVCKETCVPGGAELFVTLPVAHHFGSLSRDTRHADLFTWADHRTPRELSEGFGEAELIGDDIRLTVRGLLPQGDDSASFSARFFPHDPQSIAMSGEQRFTLTDGREIILDLPGNTISPPPARLSGVLVIHQGGDLYSSIEINLPVRGVAASDRK
ncbi:MAG: protein-disulfide reductase DsbD domain-containing protein [Planctomycetota bacterium]